MRASLASFCLGCLMSAGCCHLRVGDHAAPAQPLPKALATGFGYSKTYFPEAKETNLKRRSRYDIQCVEMAALPDRFDTNRTVTLEYYAPHAEGKKPVVIVLPISGGGYALERHVSAYFAKRAWAAVIVHRRKLPREPANGEELDAVLRQSVIDVRRAIDWAETRPELDASKVGVFGVSMGAIKAAILAPVDSRVRAAVLGMPGGDIPFILRHTTESGIARRRKAMLKEYGLQPEELEATFRTGFRCDPNTLAPYAPRENVLLALARCDRVVPIRKGRELREKMGRPETIFLPTGHYTALFCLPYVQRQAFKFFRQRFYPGRAKAEPPPARSLR